uniref:PPIase cyclophilin-type domain-containing protein n=1 Tax=Solanum lycopersicum TaxID=4081 RepID=A0A3Q7JV91_SOLLC
MEDERMVVVEEEMVMITITWQKGEGMETGKKDHFFDDGIHSGLKHSMTGTKNLNASQFYITLRDNLNTLDGERTVFGEIALGFDTSNRINGTYVDDKDDLMQKDEELGVCEEKEAHSVAVLLESVRVIPDAEIKPLTMCSLFMSNTKTDNQRIRVDFSQSVAKLLSEYRPRNQRSSVCFNNGSVDAMKQKEEDTSGMVEM